MKFKCSISYISHSVISSVSTVHFTIQFSPFTAFDSGTSHLSLLLDENEGYYVIGPRQQAESIFIVSMLISSVHRLAQVQKAIQYIQVIHVYHKLRTYLHILLAIPKCYVHIWNGVQITGVPSKQPGQVHDVAKFVGMIFFEMLGICFDYNTTGISEYP